MINVPAICWPIMVGGIDGTGGVIEVSVVIPQMYGPGTSGSIFRAETTTVYIVAFAHGRMNAIVPPNGGTLVCADAALGSAINDTPRKIRNPNCSKNFIPYIILYI